MRTAAAIIPTLGTAAERLRQTVDAVLAQRVDLTIDVVVVVNAPRPARPLGLPEPVRTVIAGANLGWAGGLHLGRAMTTAELLWLVQDDFVPDPNCLAELLSALEHGTASLVSPVVVREPDRDADGAIVDGVVPRHSLGARLDPAVFDPSGTLDGTHDGSTGILVDRFPADDVPLRAVVDTPTVDSLTIDRPLDYVPSRGMLLSAAAWDAVGGMDARNYPVGASDVEFCRALAATGRTFAIAAAARATHDQSASTPKPLARAVSRRNRQRVVATWRDGEPRTTALAAELPSAVRDAVLVGATEAVAALTEEVQRLTQQRDAARERLASVQSSTTVKEVPRD